MLPLDKHAKMIVGCAMPPDAADMQLTERTIDVMAKGESFRP